MDSTKTEIHVLIKKSTMRRLEKHFKEVQGPGAQTFSRFIENALIFYLTEKGATE